MCDVDCTQIEIIDDTTCKHNKCCTPLDSSATHCIENIEPDQCKSECYGTPEESCNYPCIVENGACKPCSDSTTCQHPCLLDVNNTCMFDSCLTSEIEGFCPPVVVSATINNLECKTDDQSGLCVDKCYGNPVDSCECRMYY